MLKRLKTKGGLQPKQEKWWKQNQNCQWQVACIFW